jgi:hypothetical protein
MLASLLAAALLQAADAPAVTAPPSAPATAAAPSSDGTPRGAPAQDYDFVAWCHGALAGHMALYEKVKPELVSIEQPGEVATDAKNDRLQMEAGRDYLALYTRALNGVDHGRPGALLERRKAAEAQGAAIWDTFKSQPVRQQMWAYVGWDLPGRCETAAKALLTPKGRLAALHSSAPDAAAPGAEPGSIDDALGAPAASPAPPAGAAPSLRGPQ